MAVGGPSWPEALKLSWACLSSQVNSPPCPSFLQETRRGTSDAGVLIPVCWARTGATLWSVAQDSALAWVICLHPTLPFEEFHQLPFLDPLQSILI